MKWICWGTRALSVAVGVYVGYLMYSKGNPMMEYIGWGVGAAAVCMVVTEVLLRLISDAAVVLNIASMCGGVYVGYVLHTRNHDMLDCIVFGMLAAGAGVLLSSMLISFAKGFKWVGNIDRELQPKAWLMLLGAEVVGVAAAALGGTGLIGLLEGWLSTYLMEDVVELIFMTVPWNLLIHCAVLGLVLSCVAWQKFGPACIKGQRWIWLLVLAGVSGAVAGTAYCPVGGLLVAMVLLVMFVIRCAMNLLWNIQNTSLDFGSSDDDSGSSTVGGWFDSEPTPVKNMDGRMEPQGNSRDQRAVAEIWNNSLCKETALLEIQKYDEERIAQIRSNMEGSNCSPDAIEVAIERYKERRE